MRLAKDAPSWNDAIAARRPRMGISNAFALALEVVTSEI
jgi:hypothetical protein